MRHKMVLKKSIFPAPQDVVWEKLQQLNTLQYIAKPFASFAPLDGARDLIWKEGETFRFHFKLFCLMPFGIHTINVIRFDSTAYEIYTKEINTNVPIWNHKITLKETNDGKTEYTDEVEIYAGWKTPVAYLWAKCFYSHRQKKWLKLLKR